MKVLRRGVKNFPLEAGRKKSRIRLKPRVFVVFIIAVLLAGLLGISISVHFEDRETAAHKTIHD